MDRESLIDPCDILDDLSLFMSRYSAASWADPPICAVSEPRKGYAGEHGWPLLVQNIHRYFLYAALIFLIFLWHDAIMGFRFASGWGVGVGSLVLLFNPTMLSFYT